LNEDLRLDGVGECAEVRGSMVIREDCFLL